MDYYNHTPFYCSACDYQGTNTFTYNRHNNSTKHKRNVTGGTYDCVICYNKYSSPQALYKHKQTCGQDNKINNNDQLYKDMINEKDNQIKFLKEQLELAQKQNEVLQNQIIMMQQNQQIQQITQPQNIIVNNQIPVQEKKKRLAITSKNYKSNIPKIIKEPKQLNNVINDYNNYFDNKYEFDVKDTSKIIASKVDSVFKSFINSFDDDNAFLYLGKNEQSPNNIYYYGKEYNNGFVEDSNVEWYKIDYKVIENIFINRVYSRIVNLVVKWSETNMNDPESQDAYVNFTDSVNSFKNYISYNKFYEIIYDKSGKYNSKK